MTYRATARGLVGVGLFGALACGGPTFSSDSGENDAGRGGAAAHSGGTKASGGAAAGQGTIGSGGASSGGSGAGRGGSSGTAGSPQAGGSSGNPSAGASSGGASSGGGSTVPDCNALAEDAREKLAAAQKCLVGGIIAECQDVVEGLCCPAIIANKASVLGKAYLAAMAAVNEADCQTPCPLIACLEPSGGTCKGADVGMCVASPN